MIFSAFWGCWWEPVSLFLKNLLCTKFILRWTYFVLEIFLGCSWGAGIFSKGMARCSWIIKSVEHALIFMALLPGYQHGERVSLSVTTIESQIKAFLKFNPKPHFIFEGDDNPKTKDIFYLKRCFYGPHASNFLLIFWRPHIFDDLKV